MNVFRRKKYIGKYSFIIIGAGSAGSVLANRLTENPDWNVLLLEEGTDENFITDVPLLAPILHITDYVRMYYSVPRLQDADGRGGCCLSMVDSRCNIASGRAIGGTSVVNFMIYSRGAPADYDGWEALGNLGWSYKDVLPYFIKSEKCRLIDKDARYHGYDGYLDVTTSPYATPLKECFLKAGQELGYDIIDYNGDKHIGFSSVQATLRNGRRASASKAFLRPIRDRKNFYMSKLSRVTKIIINPRTKTPEGVEFIKNHKTYFVSATKEIILSAGAVGSPQILMRSGIGPRDHLSSLGIRVIEDLPVGFNLQDHVTMPLLTFQVNESVTIVQSRIFYNLDVYLNYLIRKTDFLTIPGGTEGVAFINTKANNLKTMQREKLNKRKKGEHGQININSIAVNDVFETNPHANTNRLLAEDDHPDIELILTSSSLASVTSKIFGGLFRVTDEFYEEVFNNYAGLDGFTIAPILLQPKSRGRLTLKSSNPSDPPIVDINYYDHEDDINTMVEGIKMAVEIASTKVFKRYNATLLPTAFPRCKHMVFKSDAYWACIVRHISGTLGHYVGTCKMGTRENSGVVNHRLQVHGISGLRVVDNSIMPTIIAGHTNAPANMIAEKASDMIKEDWKHFIS